MGIINPVGAPEIPPQQLFPSSKATQNLGSLFHGRDEDSTPRKALEKLPALAHGTAQLLTS